MDLTGIKNLENKKVWDQNSSFQTRSESKGERMISDQMKDTLIDQIVKELIGQGTEGLNSVMETAF